MAEASKEEIAKALALWSVAQQGKTPQEWNGFISKYNIQDPFDPWPPTKEKIEIFLRRFQETILTNTEAPINITKNISTQKLDELVDEFDREYNKVKSVSTEAEERAQKHIQEIIRHTIEKTDVDPNQKNLLFRGMTVEMTDNPTITVAEAETKVVSVLEKAQPFLNEKSFENQTPKFSSLKGLNAVQKGVTAPLADALYIIAPGLQQGVMNKNFEEYLKKALDVPNALIDHLGIKAVDTLAFKQMVHGIQTDMSRMPTPGGARSFLENITSSIFHKAYVASAEQSIQTYWELVRINQAKGLPIPSANQFMASGMGLGSQAFHLGTDYMFSKAKGAALRAGLAKLGLEAVIPGAGWAVALFDLGRGLLGKAGNWLKGLAMPRAGEVPGDRAIIGVGCGAILLIFFILPFVTQLNIDSSLVTRLQMGGPGESGSPLPPYPGAPTIPGDVTGCPTKQAYTLTQCPGSSDYSHANLWAYDLGFSGAMGMPIYATHNGVVAATTGELQSGGYGNMVEIKGTTPAGTAYYTLYGHLVPRWVVRPGQQVKAGDIIGYGDDTGNSSGPHLHYEYRDAQNRAGKFGIQFMPAACVTNPGYCSLQ